MMGGKFYPSGEKYVYVCLHVYLHRYICLYSSVRNVQCICTYVYVLYVPVGICVYSVIRTYVCLSVCLYVRVCVCVCVCVPVFSYLYTTHYIRMYVHTCIHMSSMLCVIRGFGVQM